MARTNTTDKSKWRVQAVAPRDQFDSCTLTIEQWLASTDDAGEYNSRIQKWLAIIEACALVIPGINSEGLRQEPRVGFDPICDQMYFIFKASNAGTTFLVSPKGLPFGEEDDVGLSGHWPGWD